MRAGSALSERRFRSLCWACLPDTCIPIIISVLKDDLEAATELAAQVIKGLDGERIRHILRQDIL